MRSSSLTFILTLIFAVVAIQRPAFAYLDPGTGSIIVQGIIAAVVGAMVTLRLYWSKITSFFSSKSSNPSSDNSDDTAAEPRSKDVG